MIEIKSNISKIILYILIGFTIYDILYKKKKIFKENNNIEKVFKENNDEKVQNLSLNIISNFNLPLEEYNSIYNLLIIYDKNLKYCDYLFILFDNNLLSMNYKLDIANYIIWNSYNQDHINFIYDTIVEISSNRSYTNSIRSIAIDILMRSNNTKYINTSAVLLEKLRNEERKINDNNDIHTIRKQIIKLQQIPTEEIELQIQNLHRRENNIIQNQNRKSSIYNDSQNIHNHEINQSVLNTLDSSSLSSSSSSSIINIKDELKLYYPDYEKYKTEIDTTLNKIIIDQTNFKNGIKLSTIFDKIINFISNSKYKSDMIKRLGEEFVDMHGLCSTGHMTRLINVIQGFPDIPDDLKIKINPKDEIYATINSYLSSEIQKSDDEQLLDDMMIMNNRFINFIIDKMKVKVKELQKDYDKILDYDMLKLNIEDSLIQYIKNENVVKNKIMTKIF